MMDLPLWIFFFPHISLEITRFIFMTEDAGRPGSKLFPETPTELTFWSPATLMTLKTKTGIFVAVVVRQECLGWGFMR